MPIGTSDGEYFDNKFEAMVGSGVTAGLRRIPIVKDPEVSPGIDPGDDSLVVSPERLQMGRQLDQAETDPTTGMGLNISSSTESTMPPGGSEKPAGEFKSEEGTRVAPPDSDGLSPNSDGIVRPEPYGLNPPERGPGFQRPPRDEPTVLYKTKTGIEITDHDLEDATEAAMSASTGPTKNKAYIDMFVNKAKAEPVPYSALKDKPVKSGKSGSFDYEQMGNGKYEVFDPITGKTHATVDNEETAKYLAKEFNPKTLNPAASQSFLEQIPFGYSEGEWALMSPYQKKKVLDNPPEFTKWADESKKLLDELDNMTAQGKSWFTNDKVTIPITESGRLEKLSPKEAFKQGAKAAAEKFAEDMQIMAAKFRKVLKGPPEEIPPPKVSGKGDYTEPAYRGLSVYDQPGYATNPVFKFTEEGAMYSTAHPMLADMYAGYLDAHPGMKVPEGTFPAGAQVMPLLINTKDYHYFDAKGAIWQDANPKAIIEAKDAGKKGVIVDNVWDEPNSTKALSKPNKIYITFPQGAGTVKSRFAEKFDESSPNIMHGIATVGIGTAATGYIATEEQPPNL